MLSEPESRERRTRSVTIRGRQEEEKDRDFVFGLLIITEKRGREKNYLVSFRVSVPRRVGVFLSCLCSSGLSVRSARVSAARASVIAEQFSAQEFFDRG